MKVSRYILLILLLGAVLPTGLIFAVNYSIDPYYQWRFAPSYTVNLMNEMTSRARISRAYQVRFFRPQHIALGSSRCLRGIDHNYEAWPEGRCYNLAVFGAGIDESLANLRHAQGINALDTVVLGLDLFSFNQTRTSQLPNYEEILSYRDRRFGWQLERLRATASPNTLADSWTQFNSGKSSSENARASSWNDTASPPRPAMFRVAVSQKVLWYFGADRSRFSFTGSDNKSSLEYYRQLIAFCHENNIDLKLFISPIHAVQLEVIDGFGLWHTFETWKRQLVKINEETAMRFGRPPYSLWDFAEYHAFTTEPVPRGNERQRSMTYFSDPDHYKRNVGNAILNTIFGKVVTPGFGARLTSDSIEQNLARIRRERAIWRTSNPADFQEFAALARKARPKNATIDTEI